MLMSHRNQRMDLQLFDTHIIRAVIAICTVAQTEIDEISRFTRVRQRADFQFMS
jgi:hypothetical protein